MNPLEDFRQAYESWKASLGDFGPILAALLLFFAGFLVARGIQFLVYAFLDRVELDEKIARWLGLEDSNTEKAASRFVFYLVLFFVVILALDQAGLSEEVMEPLRGVMGQVVLYLPRVFVAILIGLVFWVVALILKNILHGILSAARVDERLGLGTEKPLTNAITTIVFFLIILAALPAVLRILAIQEISDAIDPIIADIFGFIPGLLGGGAIIALGVFIGSIVRKMLSSVLHAARLDVLPARLGYQGEAKIFGQTLSQAIGWIAMISILVTTFAQGIKLMNLGLLSDLAVFLARFWAATLIFVVGLFLGDLARRAIGPKNELFGTIAQYIVVFFFGGMALQKAEITQVSSNAIEYAVLGTILTAVIAFGVGGAIAIGLGGKEPLQRYLNRRMDRP